MQRRANLAREINTVAHEKAPKRDKTPINPRDLYPTGSTLLNLACSDNHRGGFRLGSIVTLPGSSASGKSFLAETALVCGLYDNRFDKYEFIRDDAEATYNFDTSYLFGEKAAERITAPPLGCSNTVQDFKNNILTLTVKEKKQVIYLLDSLDSLSSDEEIDKEMRKALAAAKSKEAADKIAGSFGMEKAKNMHQILRMVNSEMEKTGSLLIIIQQLKQNTQAVGAFAPPYKTSGGEAPFFYSFQQVWLNKTGTLKRNNRKIGTQVKADVRKNKMNGKLRDVAFDIYYDYGIDDIGSMIDFMISEGFWKKGNGGLVHAEGLGVSGTRPASRENGCGSLTDEIEEKGLEHQLRKLVAEAWKEIEDGLLLKRKPRF